MNVHVDEDESDTHPCGDWGSGRWLASTASRYSAWQRMAPEALIAQLAGGVAPARVDPDQVHRSCSERHLRRLQLLL